MASDDLQGAALGRYAIAALKLKRFAVIDDRPPTAGAWPTPSPPR
jgi:hypothetical protein